mmetsp:Transcript_41424/g.67324  ORF Transcript_41424/g.67324 Transcript_41424/m.67324 type:complete len:217 (-) Transcript_41424:159-809(-)
MDSVSIKCVMLGNSNVGKTCLVSRFLRDVFKPDTAPTIGTAFGVRTVTAVLPTGKKVTHDVGVWDTAGSERYYSMTQQYYKKSHIALICYDITNIKSWERVGFWVSELKKVEPDVTITLVGTKLDLVKEGKKREVDPSEIAKYSNHINAFRIETSALTGENVEQAFKQTVANYITLHPNHRAARRSTGGIRLPSSSQQRRRSTAGEGQKGVASCMC